jgi:hypothetical protein
VDAKVKGAQTFMRVRSAGAWAASAANAALSDILPDGRLPSLGRPLVRVCPMQTGVWPRIITPDTLAS